MGQAGFDLRIKAGQTLTELGVGLLDSRLHDVEFGIIR
jgi:hypothetical protein